MAVYYSVWDSLIHHTSANQIYRQLVSKRSALTPAVWNPDRYETWPNTSRCCKFWRLLRVMVAFLSLRAMGAAGGWRGETVQASRTRGDRTGTLSWIQNDINRSHTQKSTCE